MIMVQWTPLIKLVSGPSEGIFASSSLLYMEWCWDVLLYAKRLAFGWDVKGDDQDDFGSKLFKCHWVNHHVLASWRIFCLLNEIICVSIRWWLPYHGALGLHIQKDSRSWCWSSSYLAFRFMSHILILKVHANICSFKSFVRTVLCFPILMAKSFLACKYAFVHDNGIVCHFSCFILFFQN